MVDCSYFAFVDAFAVFAFFVLDFAAVAVLILDFRRPPSVVFFLDFAAVAVLILDFAARLRRLLPGPSPRSPPSCWTLSSSCALPRVFVGVRSGLRSKRSRPHGFNLIVLEKAHMGW